MIDEGPRGRYPVAIGTHRRTDLILWTRCHTDCDVIQRGIGTGTSGNHPSLAACTVRAVRRTEGANRSASSVELLEWKRSKQVRVSSVCRVLSTALRVLSVDGYETIVLAVLCNSRQLTDFTSGSI